MLDLGQIFLGAYAGMMLSYLGAEVIKVEPPGGETIRTRSADGFPPQVQFLNANKRGLMLDLKDDRGKAVLCDLVEEADVLLENFAPGTLDRLGVGYETLREINPGLVYAHGSGYGDDGPYADYPAMDLTVQAMSGVMHTTGFPDQPPVRAGPSICDFYGGIHLVTGVVSALVQRSIDGEGQYVDVAMFDCMYPVLASPISAWVNRRDVPPRNGNRHSDGSVAPYSAYEAADGYVAIACVTEKQWGRLTAIMGRPELAEREGFTSKVDRAERVEEVDRAVEAWTREHPKDDIVETLVAEGVPCAPVKSVGELVEDPHLESRDMIHRLPNQTSGRSTVPVPGMPIKFSASEPPSPRPAPAPGEHSAALLEEFAGYDEATIEALLEDGVLGGRG